jgi:hypothetical protein
MAKAFGILFQDNAKCLDAAVAYMNANIDLGLHTKGGWAGFFSSRKTALSTQESSVMSGCATDATYPAAMPAHCSTYSGPVATMNGRAYTDKCIANVGTVGQTGFVENAQTNCTSTGNTMNVPQFSCHWPSTSAAPATG